MYNFWKAGPLKFGRAKKRPKFCAISDHFQLWSQISPERIHTSQIRRVFYQLQPLPRWVKKIGELWPSNKNVLVAHIDPPKRTFYGTLHFGPWGTAPSNFYTRYRLTETCCFMSPVNECLACMCVCTCVSELGELSFHFLDDNLSACYCYSMSCRLSLIRCWHTDVSN